MDNARIQSPTGRARSWKMVHRAAFEGVFYLTLKLPATWQRVTEGIYTGTPWHAVLKEPYTSSVPILPSCVMDPNRSVEGGIYGDCQDQKGGYEEMLKFIMK